MVTNSYLNNILFLAFATLYPDALIRLYFVLPIKAKWLAVLYVFLTFYDIIRMDTYAVKLLLPSLLPGLIAVWLVYAVFFWDRIPGCTGRYRLPHPAQALSANRTL